MIVLFHRNGKLIRIHDVERHVDVTFDRISLTRQIFKVAKENPEKLLAWCDEQVAGSINLNTFQSVFHHQKMMVSYNPTSNFLPDAIGYVELGSFIKVNKKVTFPTWQMSSMVGAIPASILNIVKDQVSTDDDFDYFLNSLAKIAMPLGLFCYSEPKLLKPGYSIESSGANSNILFRFVKQHYKGVWVFFLLLNMIFYERKFPVFAAVASLFYKKRRLPKSILTRIPIISKNSNQKEKSIDILIPTIGRKSYLHDVLKDLARQTLLPKKVIITEQNPMPESVSELDFLTSEEWPFEIRHIFTRQPGACNARNLALSEVTSDWVFLADDDIRIERTFLEEAFNKMYEVNGDVFNFCCINPGQTRQYDLLHQTSIFAGSCSIISTESFGSTRFDTAFEFGYGEDSDFGMQLMNKGYDIEYIPEPAVRHLKAPSGGFRIKMKQLWDNDPIKPKPSPTVLLHKILHHTNEQVKGYKTTLFLKFYKSQSIRNPFKYYRTFKQQWQRSIFWANELKAANRQVETS